MDKENEKKLIDEYSERLFEEFCDADADITDPRVSNEMLSEIKLRSGIRKEKSKPVFRIVRVLRYAAILLLPVVSAISVYGIMEKRSAERELLCDSQFAVIEADTGQRASAILPDGTKVWLSSGSKISYSRDFNGGNRNVELSGEAYFDVVKNEAVPFTVNAGDLKIKVLGTDFNVKAYKDASTVSATLVRGAIEATTPGGTYRQYPDQKLVFSRVNGTTQIVDVEDSGMASSWKEGILYYDNQSLGEIAEDLQRIYGVKLIFANPGIAKMKFSGSIPDGYSNLGTVLRYISIAASLDCRVDGDIVRIK